jgi:hypothetical protein
MKQPFSFSPPKRRRKASPRESILAQWRGANQTEWEKGAKGKAKSAADLIPTILSGLRFDQRRGETEILKVWNSIIDPNIAQHAQPTGIHKGTLFVTVDSSVWLDEIVRYRRREILERLRNSFGSDLITKISFRVG